jgi:ABC-type transport system involved in cytochrome c biogenesis permease subunit
MKTRRVTVVAILAMLVGLLPGTIFAAPSPGRYMSID